MGTPVDHSVQSDPAWRISDQCFDRFVLSVERETNNYQYSTIKSFSLSLFLIA